MKLIKHFLYKLVKTLKRKVLSRPKYKSSGEFWTQKMKITTINKRLDLFNEVCSNQSVLHFGCTDWPIFRPDYNLHIKLAKITKELHGFDIDFEGIEKLKTYVDQAYFSDFNNMPKHKYDVCLIPETIEHVDNVATFLNNISDIDAKSFYITAPNCFSKNRFKHNFHKKETDFIELVHQDHNCWYSPYTLKNVIEKYSSLVVTDIFLMENDSMICCKAIKKA